MRSVQSQIDNAPCHKWLATMAKLNGLSFELLPRPPYSPDLAPSDYYLFADLKKCSKERDSTSTRKSSPKRTLISRPKINRSKKGIEMLEKRWTDCVAFEGDYVDE